MKKIYLLSGPVKDKFDDEIKKFLKRDLKGLKSITFIASTPDEYAKNDLYVYGNNDNILGMMHALKEVSDFSLVNILDNRIEQKNGKNLICNSDVIYLLGGNPITQNEYLKKNGYDSLLKEFGKIILGTSAGAMNMAKKSYYSKDDYYNESFFYNGIDLVDVSVDPHFDINNQEQVMEAKKNSSIHKIIGLPNTSAILVEKKIIYIGKCYLFDNSKMEEIN